MNPPLRNPLDAAKYREQYINNLKLQASNNQMNLNANLIYKNTEQTPSQPTDYRTVTEKFADVDGMRREVRSYLAASKLVNSTNANIVAQELNEDDLSFFIQYKLFIEKDFKGRDVPADVFINYLDNLRLKTAETNGVDFGLQQSSGEGILLSTQQIRYEMVTKQDLDHLANIIHNMNPESLRRSAESNVRELSRQLPSSSLLSAMDVASPWLQSDAITMMSMSLQNVPSRAGFDSTIRDAELAIEYPNLQAEFLSEVINTYQPNPEIEEAIQETTEFLRKAQLDDSNIQEDKSEISTIPRPYTPSITSQQEASAILSPYANLFDRLTPESSPEAYKRIHGDTSLTDRPVIKRSAPAGQNLNLGLEFQDDEPAFLTKEDKINRMNDYLGEDSARILTSNGVEYRVVPNSTHHNTVNALHRDYQKKNAHGREKMQGKGLSKREKIQHRIEGEYQKPKPYKQLGRYLINRDKLADDIVMLKRVGGSKVPEFPSQHVPHKVAKALACILRQTVPECSEMSSAEIKTLQAILKICRCSNITISNPHEKTDEEKEMDRFNILSGEIQA